MLKFSYKYGVPSRCNLCMLVECKYRYAIESASVSMSQILKSLVAASLVFLAACQAVPVVEKAESDTADICASADNDEIRVLFLEDQVDRKTKSQTAAHSTRGARDAIRRERVRALLKENKLKTSVDYFLAGLIFQHGDLPEDYLKASELAKKAVDLSSSNKSAKWLIAASTDRYLLSTGKPQWYGTQFHKVNGVFELQSLDANAVTDEQRKELNVPTLAEMAEQLKDMNDKTSSK